MLGMNPQLCAVRAMQMMNDFIRFVLFLIAATTFVAILSSVVVGAGCLLLHHCEIHQPCEEKINGKN